MKSPTIQNFDACVFCSPDVGKWGMVEQDRIWYTLESGHEDSMLRRQAATWYAQMVSREGFQATCEEGGFWQAYEQLALKVADA